jgi:hypothetical protein
MPSIRGALVVLQQCKYLLIHKDNFMVRTVLILRNSVHHNWYPRKFLDRLWDSLRWWNPL